MKPKQTAVNRKRKTRRSCEASDVANQMRIDLAIEALKGLSYRDIYRNLSNVDGALICVLQAIQDIHDSHHSDQGTPLLSKWDSYLAGQYEILITGFLCEEHESTDIRTVFYLKENKSKPLILLEASE